MSTFLITARTLTDHVTFFAIARTSVDADESARALFGDEPCGVTVVQLDEARHG
jgi:hypothetical protein